MLEWPHVPILCRAVVRKDDDDPTGLGYAHGQTRQIGFAVLSTQELLWTMAYTAVVITQTLGCSVPLKNWVYGSKKGSLNAKM